MLSNSTILRLAWFLKNGPIRIAVLCFDDQLCCILTQCMSGFCGAPSGK